MAGEADFTRELGGSLAPLPAAQHDDVGTYNVSTQTYTPGSQVIAANSTYSGSVYNSSGYRTAQGVAAAKSGTSPSWKVNVQTTLPGLSNLSIQLGAAQSSLIGASSGKLTPIDGPLAQASVSNTSSTNSLTIGYLGLWLD